MGIGWQLIANPLNFVHWQYNRAWSWSEMTHFELIPLFEPNPESIQSYEAGHLLPFVWKIPFIENQRTELSATEIRMDEKNYEVWFWDLPILVEVEFILIEKWVTMNNIEYSKYRSFQFISFFILLFHWFRLKWRLPFKNITTV